jgi:hypothetical protein
MTTHFQAVLPGVRLVSRVEPSGWCFNTILISAGDGLVVYSPTRKLGDDAHVRISEMGEPRHLICANHFHHLGIEEWMSRYPGAAVYARAQALPRLTKMYPSSGIRAIDELDGLLAPGVSRIEPVGTRNGEVWLRTQDAWIVGDAFFNVRPPVTGVTGLLLRMTGTAPGLRIGKLWARFHLADRASYRSWLDAELARQPPSWLIPAHGDPISRPDLAGQLGTLAARSLD